MYSTWASLVDWLRPLPLIPPPPPSGKERARPWKTPSSWLGGLSGQRVPVTALRAYEARRGKRSAAIIEQFALVGKVGQWEQSLLCSLRDGLTPLAFATLLPRLFVAHVSIPS